MEKDRGRSSLRVAVALALVGCAPSETLVYVDPETGREQVTLLAEEAGLVVSIEPADHAPPFARHRISIVNRGPSALAIESVVLLSTGGATRTFAELDLGWEDPGELRRVLDPGASATFDISLPDGGRIDPGTRGLLRVRYRIFGGPGLRTRFVDVPVRVVRVES